jgi:hypothetical protein
MIADPASSKMKATIISPIHLNCSVDASESSFFGRFAAPFLPMLEPMLTLGGSTELVR